ncbi:MAG: hypothetical protein RMK99_17210 [Anaerolineales bacterium]|nr:hypothetical protein [Anaerolineales bacterium]
MCAIEGDTSPIVSIFVVLPALNAARRLPALLAVQMYPPTDVIVVDGGSTNTSLRRAEPACRLSRGGSSHQGIIEATSLT